MYKVLLVVAVILWPNLLGIAQDLVCVADLPGPPPVTTYIPAIGTVHAAVIFCGPNDLTQQQQAYPQWMGQALQDAVIHAGKVLRY